MPSTRIDIQNAYQTYAGYLDGDLPRLILVMLITLLVAASNTALIWFIGEPFTLLQQANYNELARAISWCAVFVCISLVLSYLNAGMANRLSLGYVGRLRQALLQKVMQVSFPILNRFSKGDILVRLSQDIDRALYLVVELPLTIASYLFAVTLYGFMLIMIDWQMTLIASLFLPLLYLQQRYFAVKKQLASKNFMRTNAKLLAFEEQCTSNLKNISAYSLESLILDRQKEKFHTSKDWLLYSRLIDIRLSTLLTATIYTCAIVLVFSGTVKIENGLLQTGAMISFLLYIAYLSAPVRGLSMLPLQIRESMAAIDRINEILQLPTGCTDKPDAGNLKNCQGQISLRNLSFCYGENSPLLKDIDLQLPAGQTVGFAGLSGSGKSTAVNLILRHYQPDHGCICLDGQDINDVTLASLRRQITVVTPEPFLLDASIRENLLMANSDATDEQIIQACVQAQAWEFISELENGLDTCLGENGISLSTGQSQRLCIARVFLRDTPIVILDEATSSVDSQREKQIYASLAQYRKGRTTIIIAHRYTAFQSASLIVYFNKDGSVTTGNHVELLEHHPAYRQAIELQTIDQQTGLNQAPVMTENDRMENHRPHQQDVTGDYMTYL